MERNGLYLAVIFLLLWSQGLSAQKSLKIRAGKNSTTTRAVIVGISDYQNDQIPDLQYADKDALAYAEFLKSAAGGSIPSDQIKVHINEKATGGNVHLALDWLVNESKKGDQCIIYFSGHGDVETKFEKEPGHFLVYDSPSSTYQINSLRVEDLQQLVGKLSKDIGAKVTVVTDACRSGKLAGSGIKGAQATAAALLDQFANEIKIMSCQADEYALEGKQWGGGRGLFSYHFIDGLTGLADANRNDKVSLKELQRYLEDRFDEEIMDVRQTPVMIGDRRADLAAIDKGALQELIAYKNADGPSALDEQLASVDQIELPVKKEADLQAKFYSALAAKNLLSSKDRSDTAALSASFYFESMLTDPIYKDKLPYLRGELIAALQDDAQAAINRYLALDQTEMRNRWFSNKNDFGKYAEYLGKAAELLGEDHYLYPQVKAKEIYFEVVSQRINLRSVKAKPEAYDTLQSKLNKALEYQPRSPFINNEMGLIFERQKKYKEAIGQYEEAIKISPTWALPWNNKGFSYLLWDEFDMNAGYLDSTIFYCQKAINLSEEFDVAYSNLSHAYFYKGNYGEAITHRKSYVNLNPTLCKQYSEIGYLEYKNKNYKEALISLGKSLECDSTLSMSYFREGLVYKKMENFNSALASFQKAKDLNYNSVFINLQIAYVYEKLNLDAQAIYHYEIFIKDKPKDIVGLKNLMLLYINNKEYHKLIKMSDGFIEMVSAKDKDVYYYRAQAFAAMNKLPLFQLAMDNAIDLGFKDYKKMEENVSFSSIRKSEAYKTIVESLKIDY